ncbi:TPA: transposase family protein, partial [Legionella pneumophila]|nr:transposase family protein [Legionella pneumophila]
GALEGNFVWSLTMTDILLTWTENWAVWNKGAYGVGNAIDDVEANLPFEIKGFDCDNGSELLNYYLIRKFAERPQETAIQFTRSRPYKKNDNAHVEHISVIVKLHAKSPAKDEPQWATVSASKKPGFSSFH